MNVQPSILQDPEVLQAVLKKNSFDSLADMYAAIRLWRSDSSQSRQPGA